MENKYTTILIKKELKEKMKQAIIDMNIKISYPQLIEILLENYNKNLSK